jgi:hypothetical protein
MKYYIETLNTEDTACGSKMVVYYDSVNKMYGISNRRNTGFLFHGRYFLFTRDGDTLERGQYRKGVPVGTYISYDRFNKKPEAIVVFKNGSAIKDKRYHVDEDHKRLQFVRIQTDTLNQNGWTMQNPHVEVYDSAEKHLQYEEIPVNNYHKRIQTYYPNRKIHELFFMNYSNRATEEKRIGRYEEFYPDGTRKTIGQYNFIHEPTGIWIYFDKKGGKTIKNFSNPF